MSALAGEGVQIQGGVHTGEELEEEQKLPVRDDAIVIGVRERKDGVDTLQGVRRERLMETASRLRSTSPVRHVPAPMPVWCG